MKYCPNCGKSGVEGMKFCSRCGQRLAGSSFEEKKRYVPKPQAPFKEKNWFERHPGWTLLLVIICSPFILWGIVLALIMLALLFPPSIGEAFVRGAISAGPLGYIAIIIFGVRWYKARKRQSKAASDYDKAIELNPSNADAYCERGDFYYETDEYNKAIADYSRAIELDSGYASAYFDRAYAYGEIGDYDKAITDYSKAIELDTSDAQAYYNRGLDYRNKGEVAKAVNDLERCLSLSNDPELTKDAQQALLEIKNSP